MKRSRFVPSVALCLCVFVLPHLLCAAEPYHFPEKTHGKGQLKYTADGLPLLIVEGSPAEIGEQVAELAIKPAVKVLDYPRDLLKRFGAGAAYPLLAKTGETMLDSFPADARKEFDAMVKAGVDRELLVVGNTVFDLKKSLACSALQIAPERSVNGGVLFGRNLDYPSLGYIHEYSLVTVYRPTGKHAFVAVGFPGLVGCLSGMNDAGLAVGVLEIYAVKPGVERFDLNGTPYAVCYRRVLEECTTIDEAEKLLRSMKRTTTTCLAVSDKKGSAVFEITPKELVVRQPVGGICVCTNHFCTKELSPGDSDRRFRSRERFAELEKVSEIEKIDVADVKKRLHVAAHPTNTLQSMIFEPAKLRISVAIGKCPATEGEMKPLELGPLFKK
jgi:hypothetical protein